VAKFGSDEYLAEALKKRETEFCCKLRTQQQLSVASTAQAVLERMLSDPILSNLIEHYTYTTTTLLLHGKKNLPFRNREDFMVQLPQLAKEPRAIIFFGNDSLTFTCNLHLNCTNTLVKEKVAGKQRTVPEKADHSLLRFDFSGEDYCTPAFLEAFLCLIGNCFGIIGGESGWARNRWLDFGTQSIWTNAYDRRYGNEFAHHYLNWANLFGPQDVAGIGRERFRSAPAHTCVDLPGGGILLTVCADPRDFATPAVQETVARVKKQLAILLPSERASPEEVAAYEAEIEAARNKSILPTPSPFAEAFRQANEQTPGEMARQAAGTVEGAKRFWKVTLDYTLTSVAVIDGFILTGFGFDEDEDDIEGGIQAFGAYVGECVRRHCGGSWRDEDMKGQPVLLDIGPKRQRFGPFRAVRQRFDKREQGTPLQDLVNSIGK
jgi:hypothetical protein